jgi:multidrug efflux pump subunit AcrA (membrane-fusion protein)
MRRLYPLILTVALALTACKRPAANATASTQESPRPPSNRIDVPESVRSNLGITFAKVERRRVDSTIRLPGRFELLPTARREYRVALAGRIELLVKQYDKVEPGTPLFRMDSAEWHRTRLSLEESHAAVEKAQAALEVAGHARAEGEAIVKFLEARVKALAEMDVKRAEVDAELAAKRAALPRLDSEIKARQIDLHEAQHHLPIVMSAAASALGVTPGYLTEIVDRDHETHAMPRWRTIHVIEVKATQAGVVETLHVSSGANVEATAAVVTSVDPQSIRFAAVALQSDLAKLKDGLPATVVPPHRSPSDAKDAVQGKVSLGFNASPDTRTIELLITPQSIPPWARAGISAYAEVVTDGTGEEEPAIPVASVIQDELTKVFFRRDPNDPDKVIRVEADLGVSDGRWVVVNSGVAAGDEVVLDGVYELKLVGAGRATGGGHFHADGTWHADGTPEPGGKK